MGYGVKLPGSFQKPNRPSRIHSIRWYTQRKRSPYFSIRKEYERAKGKNTYLVACSARMLSDESALEGVLDHSDFIREDSKKTGLKEVVIRLHTEVDASEDGIDQVKNSLLNNLDNVHIEHIKNVSNDDMKAILDFCSWHELGLTHTTEQSKEQKEKEAAEHLPQTKNA